MRTKLSDSMSAESFRVWAEPIRCAESHHFTGLSVWQACDLRTNREKYAFCGVWGDATKQASAEPTLKVPGFTLPSTVHELLSKLLVTS